MERVRGREAPFEREDVGMRQVEGRRARISRLKRAVPRVAVKPDERHEIAGLVRRQKRCVELSQPRGHADFSRSATHR